MELPPRFWRSMAGVPQSHSARMNLIRSLVMAAHIWLRIEYDHSSDSQEQGQLMLRWRALIAHFKEKVRQVDVEHNISFSW